MADAADEIVDKWNRSRSELTRPRGDYQLNRAFFEGYHEATFIPSEDQLAYSTGLAHNRTDQRHNKFRSNAEVLLGKWTQSPLGFEVPATSASDYAVNAARIAEHVLRYAHAEQNWEGIRQGTIDDVLMGGSALITVGWDPKAPSMSIDPVTGQPSGTGEVYLRSYSIDEFTLSPGARTPEQARWLLTGQALDPDFIKDFYGMSEAPRPDASGLAAPAFYRSTAGSGRVHGQLALLLVMYKPPMRSGDKGKIIHVTGGKVVHEEKWPYPFETIPGYVFRASFSSARWWGTTFMSEARPLQRRYNRCRTKQAEHVDNASNVRLMTPYGMLVNGVESLTDTAGEIIEYHAEDGVQAPHYLVPPPSPRALDSELERLDAEIADIMHVHDISRGKAPGDRNSGTALAILAEQDETPLGLMAQDQARGWARIGELVIGLYAENAKDPRAAVYRPGRNMPSLRVSWDGGLFKSVRRVHVPLESTTPVSKAARQQNFLGMVERFPAMAEQITPAMLAKVFDVPVDKWINVIEPSAASALLENQLMLQGEVPFPQPFEKHATHMAEHNAFRETPEYRYAPDAVKELIDNHIKAHQRLQEEELAQQQALNAAMPGAAAMPQADAPIGAASVPPVGPAAMM